MYDKIWYHNNQLNIFLQPNRLTQQPVEYLPPAKPFKTPLQQTLKAGLYEPHDRQF